MSDVVIKAENLGKKYTIGHQTERGRYVALRDVLVNNARSLWRATTDLVRGRPLILGNDLEEVWALKDVSFEIRRGEAVGIIGRNGAGKSTLLKVLSRITEPSAGRVTIKGRVASLLEVGTGFHPELTGRENIYLNGAILGMSRAEVKRKFDEIVAFAEIEKYLDTPVKRYSSGMYVRLAFAVAAHLEPEILLVDEVLAVGDAAFQKKCLGKMGEVAQEGQTVLFVSHNMAALQNLCKRAILIKDGQIVAMGYASEVIKQYINQKDNPSWTPPEECHDNTVSLVNYQITDLSGEPLHFIEFLQPFQVRLRFRAKQVQGEGNILLRMVRNDGTRIASISTREIGAAPVRYYDSFEVIVAIHNNVLLPGEYYLELRMGNQYSYSRPDCSVDRLPRLEVTPRILPGGSHSYGAEHGLVYLDAEIFSQPIQE